MRVEEIGGEVVDNVGAGEGEEESGLVGGGRLIVLGSSKRVLVGVGARALFYPTLVYNVVRNKIQTEFRWWDRVDEFVLLGAVPFPTDVPRLKELGVQGVITLNEPYETLVASSIYESYGIDHLVIPTRDYCFAPSMDDICQAVDFIHGNALNEQTTYVHCKAGRGRSTTIVICYLVQHKHMTPDDAYDYVKSIRPRVCLASSQWQAVQNYYHLKVKTVGVYDNSNALVTKKAKPYPRVTKEAKSYPRDAMVFDDSSVVLVTEADIEGYNLQVDSAGTGTEILRNLNAVYRVKVASQTALTRLSCLWLRCNDHRKITGEEIIRDSNCSARSDTLAGNINFDIHVY